MSLLSHRQAALALFLPWVLLVGCSHKPKPVSPIVVEDRAPSWSPDGLWIAYAHFSLDSGKDPRPTGLYLVSSASGSPSMLVSGEAGNPDWAPRGDQVVFQGAVLQSVSTSTKGVATILPFHCFYPSWSPDCSRIAFDSPYQSPTGSSTVWISNADGTGLKNISQQGVGEWRNPDWSPDGTRLVHERYSGSAWTDLFIMDTLGVDVARLTSNNYDDRDPSWSPDGLSIAWTSLQIASRPSIWLMDANGLNKRKLADGQEPSWSPDGLLLAFSAPLGDGTRRLFVIHRDGSGLRQLTN